MDLSNIIEKLHANQIATLVHKGLFLIGIKIYLFYLVLEGLSDKNDQNFKPAKPNLDEYELEYLGPKDMDEISFLPGRKIAREKLLQQLKEGRKCLGIKNEGKIIAFTWCNFDEITVDRMKFPLKSDEAYLFDAYTFIPFRGKGIAPYLRYEMYKELSKLGKHKLYSGTAIFNTSAAKFKKKLDAKILRLEFILILLKKRCFHLTLKKYK